MAASCFLTGALECQILLSGSTLNPSWTCPAAHADSPTATPEKAAFLLVQMLLCLLRLTHGEWGKQHNLQGKNRVDVMDGIMLSYL